MSDYSVLEEEEEEEDFIVVITPPDNVVCDPPLVRISVCAASALTAFLVYYLSFIEN